MKKIVSFFIAILLLTSCVSFFACDGLTSKSRTKNDAINDAIVGVYMFESYTQVEGSRTTIINVGDKDARKVVITDMIINEDNTFFSRGEEDFAGTWKKTGDKYEFTFFSEFDFRGYMDNYDGRTELADVTLNNDKLTLFVQDSDTSVTICFVRRQEQQNTSICGVYKLSYGVWNGVMYRVGDGSKILEDFVHLELKSNCIVKMFDTFEERSVEMYYGKVWKYGYWENDGENKINLYFMGLRSDQCVQYTLNGDELILDLGDGDKTVLKKK